jgi:hypothetical protein
MTQKIIFIKSLFCPNQTYFNITYNSILNNINYILSLNLSINIILIGWIKKEFYDKINLLIQIVSNQINIIFIPWDVNYGKIKLYYEFNNIAKNVGYILYADHDILFDLTKTKMQKILDEIDKLFSIYNFSLVVFNQLEDCRHQTSLLDNIENYNDIMFGISESNIDMGGGCFIIKNIKMKDPLYYHVYGFDEKYLISCFENKKCGLLLDYYVIHPYDFNDNNLNYKKWKINKIISQIDIYDKINDDEYKKQINESYLLWENM